MSTASHAPRRTGDCALVGAGPGDPELLTLQALRVLRRATVLLVDDLVSDAVLATALRGRRKPPRVVHVGKRGGCQSTPQAFIERLMVTEAQRGERVVRLKGGDPFVFGRGGEEAQALRAHGIAVEVVHGITAGLAAAGALGVPWTHRDHAHGVMLVTGHAREGGAAPDWAVLGAAAAQGLTLVVYMGMARLADAAARPAGGAAAAHPGGRGAARRQRRTNASSSRRWPGWPTTWRRRLRQPGHPGHRRRAARTCSLPADSAATAERSAA